MPGVMEFASRKITQDRLMDQTKRKGLTPREILDRRKLDPEKLKRLIELVKERRVRITPEEYKKRNETEVRNYVEQLAQSLYRRGFKEFNPITAELFTDPKFFNSLPPQVRRNPRTMEKLFYHNTRLQNLIGNPRERASIFGERVTIAESVNEFGRQRAQESGERIKLDALRAKGIDPRFILVFRITQPSDIPKSEFYWTTDFHETQTGLQGEIPPEKRANAVILISTLETINKGRGLIRDINDDNGLAVRQISNLPFDQHLCLSRVKAL